MRMDHKVKSAYQCCDEGSLDSGISENIFQVVGDFASTLIGKIDVVLSGPTLSLGIYYFCSQRSMHKCHV